MKASELRYGNLLIDKETGKVVIFVCLDEESPLNRIYIKLPEIEESEWDKGWPIIDVDAILLTEEWLLKFGFVKLGKFERNGGLDYETIYKIEAKVGILSYICFYEKPGESYWYLKYGMTDIYVKDRLKYIHQLQNLYFALVGEELEEK